MEIIFAILSEDNIRTLVTLVTIASGVIWLRNSQDKRFAEQDAKIDKKFEDLGVRWDKKLDDFHLKLKTNDFAHLNDTIGELIFILEKNGFLKITDMEHIKSKLDK